MLGHGLFTTNKDYCLQTLKDNLQLFTPHIMERINVEVIRAGYQLLDVDIHSLIRGRCDSFVLKTDVHFLTDINLLYDAIRVLIRECVKWNKDYALPEWRQHKYNLNRFKALYRKIQKLRHSTSKNEDKKQAKAEQIKKAHQQYIDLAQTYLNRVERSIERLKHTCKVPEILLSELTLFTQHAERQIDQIKCRVIDEEKIAVEMVKATKNNFPSFNGCSFDKGFHSIANQLELKKELEQVVLPKKGGLSATDKEREYDEEFIQAKKKHSAVESAINALQGSWSEQMP